MYKNITNAYHKKAYSLIEVVVVVAIVGILISLSTISYTVVRNNSENKNKESQVKIFASALENFANYNDTVLTCSLITDTPANSAKTLEIKPEIIANPETPTQTRVSCSKAGKTKPANSDSFFVSGLGCPVITIEYNKKGGGRGAVTAKGPVPSGTPCLTPNPDSL